MEIEKKYLFEAFPGDLNAYESAHMIQAYINRDPVIRVRANHYFGGEKDGQMQYVLTIKGRGLTMREEHELLLTEDQFNNLMEKVTGKVIEKTRYRIPLDGGLVAEADVFEGDHQGLKLVEVEFPSEESMLAFKAPAWFGEDVSGTNRYHNSELSKE